MLQNIDSSYETVNFGKSIFLASGGYGVPAFGGRFFGVGPAAIVNDVRIGGRDVGFDGFIVNHAIYVNADSSAQVMGNDVRAGWIAVMLGPNTLFNVVNADPSIRDRSVKIERNRVFWTFDDTDFRDSTFLSAVFVGAFGGNVDVSIRDNQLTIEPLGLGNYLDLFPGYPTAIFLNSGVLSPRWDGRGTPPSLYYVPTSFAVNFSGNLVTSNHPCTFMEFIGGPIDFQSDDNNVLLGDWSILFRSGFNGRTSTTSFLLLNGHEFEP